MMKEIKKEIKKMVKEIDIEDSYKKAILDNIKYLDKHYEFLRVAIQFKTPELIIESATWLGEAFLEVEDFINSIAVGEKPEIVVKLDELSKKIEDYYNKIIENASSRLKEIVK